MNLNNLKEAEKNFLELYPGGFKNPEMEILVRKHQPDKMFALAQESFALAKFDLAHDIVDAMVKIVSRSSMISVFEKPKFRDFCKSLNKSDIEQLASGLKIFLYENEEAGFNMILDILQKGKLAKWSLITVWLAYFYPDYQVFVKPTTAKGIIEYFEVEDLIYKPTPTYAFYKSYRDLINSMKEKVDKSLSPSNPAFSGFLMMSMG